MTVNDIADELFPYLSMVEGLKLWPDVHQRCEATSVLCGVTEGQWICTNDCGIHCWCVSRLEVFGDNDRLNATFDQLGVAEDVRRRLATRAPINTSMARPGEPACA